MSTPGPFRGRATAKTVVGFKHIPSHLISDYTGALQPLAWEDELPSEFDGKDNILHGIRSGFRLVNLPGYDFVELDNYGSATCMDNKTAVEKQICTEIEEGRYIIVDEKPTIISALGAIVKKNGKIRLIHDASRPDGHGLNSYAVLDYKLQFESIGHAEQLLNKGYFMAKLDLKSAYRSVLVHPSQYHLTGLKWTFTGDKEATYLVDTRLPFGARFSPGIFHTLTQAVKCMMAARGHTGLVVYLDDFLVIEPTKEECTRTLNVLMDLVRKLGFSIAWDKVEGPTTQLTFLGIELDTEDMHMRLPKDKVCEFSLNLDDFISRSRVSLRQCQELAGKINWVTQVCRVGRPYLRRLFEASKVLKAHHHKMLITAELKEDLLWWKALLHNFNGVRLIQPYGPTNFAYVQSSPLGAGMVCNGEWYYVHWQADLPWMHNKGWIDKEVVAILVCLLNWAHKWNNSTAILCSKSRAAVNNFLQGRVQHRPIRTMIGLALLWSALFNIRLLVKTAKHGEFYSVDCVANMSEPGYIWALEACLGIIPCDMMQCASWMLLSKMSLHAFYALYPQVCRWHSVKKSWQTKSLCSGPEHLPPPRRGATLHTYAST